MSRSCPDKSRDAMRGSSFVELMFAIAIVGIAVMVQIQQITITLREHNVDLETQFAYQKAAGMLAELQASLDQGLIQSAEQLEHFDDTTPNALLTTRAVASADHVMSGNTPVGEDGWRWYRDIDVEPIEGSSRSRYVRVRVHRATDSGDLSLAAIASGILNMTVRAEALVQEFDVYAIAIGEVPSLWQPLPTLRAQLQSMVADIAGANPNLRFRVHWITKLGYGRNPHYVPYVNQSVGADAAAPYVYWYPGKLDPSSGFSALYSADLIAGRVRTEAGVLHDFDLEDNPYPHAVADRFNHCVRTPEARELFALRVAAGIDDPDEPPLQLLLADMHADPARFKNSILINLHGEALPFPPLRNYSDAAQEPACHPGVRVVTHPARLHTKRGSSEPAVEFRTYAFTSDPDSGPTVLDVPITLQIFGGDFRASLSVGRQKGGIDENTGCIDTGTAISRLYAHGDAPLHGSGSLPPFAMSYEVGYATTPSPHTWVRFHNTPLVCPPVNGMGIHPPARLYGLDYVPSPVWDDVGFYAMSNVTGEGMPKNTVRWRVQIPQSALVSQLGNADMITAITTIGTDTSAGQMWPTEHQPLNSSTTYAWWSNDPRDVPITERYQFLGDPRHNPYFDLFRSGESFANAYNWWFDDLHCEAPNGFGGTMSVDGANVWSCLDSDRLHDGFGHGVVHDVPRMLQVWREALTASRAILVNPGGPLAGALLLGGEFAMPGDHTAGSAVRPVRVAGSLFGVQEPLLVDDISPGASASAFTAGGGGELSMMFAAAPGGETAGIANRIGSSVVRSSSGALLETWLGELADDADLATFASTGNLPTASGAMRALRSEVGAAGMPTGTDWNFAAGQALGDHGATSLLQTGAHTRLSFHAPMGGASSTLTDEVYAFGQSVGLASPRGVSGGLPFALTPTSIDTLPHAGHASDFPPFGVTWLGSFASSSADGTFGAGLIRLDAPTGTTSAGAGTAYFVPLADTPQTAEEHRATIYRALTYGLRALFVASEPQPNLQVEAPLPILAIEMPTPKQTFVSPQEIELHWSTAFVRFDGKPYTEAIPSTGVGSEIDLAYVVTYRHVDGEEWFHATDGSPAAPGVWPTDPLQVLADSGNGVETFTVPTTAARFPAGEWMFRVECVRQASRRHRSVHEVVIVIER